MPFVYRQIFDTMLETLKQDICPPACLPALGNCSSRAVRVCGPHPCFILSHCVSLCQSTKDRLLKGGKAFGFTVKWTAGKPIYQGESRIMGWGVFIGPARVTTCYRRDKKELKDVHWTKNKSGFLSWRTELILNLAYMYEIKHNFFPCKT